METETRIILALALIVAVSGCTDNTNSASGEGLTVETSISDKTITPGQEAMVELRLKNNHVHEVTLEDVSLYNTGVLEAEKSQCSSEKLPGASKDYIPEAVCQWTIKVPETGSGVETKPINFKANIEYSSKISNAKNPFKLRFNQLSDIEKKDEKTVSYSNGEVEMTLYSENPRIMSGGPLNVKVDSLNSGRVKEDYKFSFQPETVFQDCETGKTVEPTVGDKAVFSCEVVPGNSEPVTRNLEVSASYKYVKSPDLSVEVVQTQ